MALKLKLQYLGKKRDLAVHSSDTIESVKFAIQNTLGFTPTSVLLDGVHLMNGKKLADYHADLASIVSVKRRKVKAGGVTGGTPDGADAALVTPRKAARSLRRRPLTTMDVDVKALAEAQRLCLEGPFMEFAGSWEVLASGLLPKKEADAQTLLQSLNTCNGCVQEARQKIMESHATVL